MLPLRLIAWLFSVGVMVLCASAASGQNYPYRPIRIVVPGTGGGSDVMARMIGQGLTATVGQQIVVENRPTGVIPGEIVSKARQPGLLQ